MKETIELKAKKGEKYRLVLMKKADGSESKTYLLKSSNSFFESSNNYLKPDGGPMIVVGEVLEDAEAVVKSIDYIIGKGYIITFE